MTTKAILPSALVSRVMETPFQVDMADAIQFPPTVYITYDACFNTLSDGEGIFFKYVPVTCVFAGKWLNDLGEFRGENRKQRPNDPFGDPATARGPDLILADWNGPAIEGKGGHLANEDESEAFRGDQSPKS